MKKAFIQILISKKKEIESINHDLFNQILIIGEEPNHTVNNLRFQIALNRFYISLINAFL